MGAALLTGAITGCVTPARTEAPTESTRGENVVPDPDRVGSVAPPYGAAPPSLDDYDLNTPHPVALDAGAR